VYILLRIPKLICSYCIGLIDWLLNIITDFWFHIKRSYTLWISDCKMIWKEGDKVNTFGTKLWLSICSIVVSWKKAHEGVHGTKTRVKNRKVLLGIAIKTNVEREGMSWKNFVIWAHIQMKQGFSRDIDSNL
jgi:hypothetical protein